MNNSNTRAFVVYISPPFEVQEQNELSRLIRSRPCMHSGNLHGRDQFLRLSRIHYRVQLDSLSRLLYSKPCPQRPSACVHPIKNHAANLAITEAKRVTSALCLQDF